VTEESALPTAEVWADFEQGEVPVQENPSFLLGQVVDHSGIEPDPEKATGAAGSSTKERERYPLLSWHGQPNE